MLFDTHFCIAQFHTETADKRKTDVNMHAAPHFVVLRLQRTVQCWCIELGAFSHELRTVK